MRTWGSFLLRLSLATPLFEFPLLAAADALFLELIPVEENDDKHANKRDRFDSGKIRERDRNKVNHAERKSAAIF